MPIARYVSGRLRRWVSPRLLSGSRFDLVRWYGRCHADRLCRSESGKEQRFVSYRFPARTEQVGRSAVRQVWDDGEMAAVGSHEWRAILESSSRDEQSIVLMLLDAR